MAIGTFAGEELRTRVASLPGGWCFTNGDHDRDQIQVA